MGYEYKELASETQVSTIRGTSSTFYRNSPVMWGGDLVDAAQNNLFFLQAVDVRYLPEGMAQLVVKKRNNYLGGSGVTFDTSEATTADITNTAINNLDGVVISPTVCNAHVTITNFAIRTNIFDLVAEARNELSYALADRVDAAIALAIGDATETTSSAAGAQTIYGGDATSDTTLASGDILTPALVTKAARLLKDNKAYYWSSTTFTLSADTKNPWNNSPDDPYILFVGPAQENALRDSSQFTNASEYGGREVVLNGEIGKFMGIKIVVANNVERVAAAGTSPDGASTTGAAMTRCLLVKAKKAYCFVWGEEPRFTIAPVEVRAQKAVVLESAYAGSVVHADAVIKIDVADD